MVSVWSVTFATTEKHHRTKRDAVAWCRARSGDQRMRPTVIRRGRGAYTFYGPGREEIVLRAHIDHLVWPSLRRRCRAYHGMGNEAS